MSPKIKHRLHNVKKRFKNMKVNGTKFQVDKMKNKKGSHQKNSEFLKTFNFEKALNPLAMN